MCGHSAGSFVLADAIRGRIILASVILACLLVSGGCRPAAESANGGLANQHAAGELTPTAVLEAMVRAYRDAEAYSDRGILCLRYQQKGTRYHDEAPMAVVRESKNRLRVHAYQAVIVSDGVELMAHVANPGEDEMGRQVLVVPAPSTLSLDTLLADPILQSAVTGGAGRLPIQLELLLGDAPLAAVLPASIEKRFVRETRVEGHPCHGIEVATEEGKFVFWIDKATSVLRQLDYPAEVVPAELGAERPSLVAEFRGARFTSTAEEQTFAVSVTPGDVAVSSFVIPPAPLPTTLLGERFTDFHFLNPSGDDVTAESLVGRVAVMLWFSDHPACQSALTQLDQVRETLDSNEVVLLAVCTESSQRSHRDIEALMRQWDIQLPLVRDLRAFGRDLFALPGAPALVVLDSNGVMQIFEVGANPNLAAELPSALARIVAGDDLAAESKARYEAEVAAFRAAIH